MASAEATVRFLRSFQLLFRSARLYQKNHPRVLESLEAAEHNLRAAFEILPTVAVSVERGKLIVPALAEPLPDPRGEWSALAEELSRCGITSLAFLPETNLGEFDNLVQRLSHRMQTGALLRESGQDWVTWCAKHHVLGIRINEQLERKVDTGLASLTAALMAYGGPTDRIEDERATVEELSAALHLLARLDAILGHAPREEPQEVARSFHAALAEADRRTVSWLVSALTNSTPGEGEAPEAYVARLADALVQGFASEEFRAGRVKPAELHGLFRRLSNELASAARELTSAGGPASGGKKSGGDTAHPGSSLLVRWSDEACADRLCEAFWAELPAKETFAVLHSREAWCVPTTTLCRRLEQWTEADPHAPAGTPRREAQLMLLNYARCLESEEGKARRAVAAGLCELYPLLERVWPQQLPKELSQSVVRALAGESSPGIAALLAAVTENLARLAVAKGDYAEFERILGALESAPSDPEHAHLSTLAGRVVADQRWVTLVDAALAQHALDPALTRLLRRDPRRLLDRLALLLTASSGLDILPAMTRLLRAIGEPVIRALETCLFEPRRQRAAAAVKLLAATQPQRLVAALLRALPSWDWSLQDLAVSELARTNTPGIAWAFTTTVTGAHPMVVPMMLDHIGAAQETAAVPLLLEIAAGKNERLRDMFTRIKAVEALGRMQVAEAAELLRAILRQRNGLTHTEPAGLRSAAEEALALIENHPSPARIRTVRQTVGRADPSFTRPRRYPRVPLSSPLTAQIEGSDSGTARVRTISLGGAFLESKRQLAVGSSIRIEIRAGLRRIEATAVVRNVTPKGGGVEFVHMRPDDREKLRRVIRRLLRP